VEGSSVSAIFSKLTGLVLALPWIASAQTADAAWSYGEGKDKLDNSTWYAAISDAKETAVRPNLRPEETNKTAELHIWCKAGKMAFFYKIEDTLVGGRLAKVSYRFDDKPPVKDQSWENSADSSALGSYNHKRAIAFSKKVLSAKSLFIRTQDAVFGQSEAEFDLQGLDLKSIREACKW